MICSYDLVSEFYISVIGCVYLGIMCIFKSVFVVEDSFCFINFEVVVYELGYRYIKIIYRF